MRKRRALCAALLLYIALLLRLTVLRPGWLHAAQGGGRLNLCPGIAYRDLLSWGSYRAAARLFFGNLLCFAPIGFALRRLGVGFSRRALYALALSLGIEAGQVLLSTGIGETDDVLLNTAGAMLGGVLTDVKFCLRPAETRRSMLK